MPIIPTWLHGALDYALAALLMVSPWLFAYDDMGAATGSAIAAALVVVLYSIFTRYELAIWRNIPVKVHLMLDAAVGLLLALSPWMFGFVQDTWMVHVGTGALWIVGAVITQTVPVHWRPHHERA